MLDHKILRKPIGVERKYRTKTKEPKKETRGPERGKGALFNNILEKRG